MWYMMPRQGRGGGEQYQNWRYHIESAGFSHGYLGRLYRVKALGNRRNEGASFYGHLIEAMAHGRSLQSSKIEASNSRRHGAFIGKGVNVQYNII